MAEVYLVGGSVRDRLLNLPVTDRDWVVVGATPDELLSLGYQQVGKDFPVFLHPVTKEEYALARTERKSGNGYTGFICDFDKSITLEQDLIRRDLTINAIAMDEKGNIVDPYHGVDDLNHKILRHVSPAFREDPLRVLRVARFAARYWHLGFVVADETLALMKQITVSGEVSFLTAERVWKETEKALSTANPQVYFQVLEQCEALTVLFPSLSLSVDVIEALKFSAQLSDDKTVRFGVLCAKLASKQAVELLCNTIKAPNHYRQVAMLAQQYANQVKSTVQLSAEQIINLLNGIDVWRHPHRLQQLTTISQAYANTMVYPQTKYLFDAYQIANNVDVQQIISQGFVGKQIQIELNKKRIEALLDWI